jgi:hypothetical protein
MQCAARNLTLKGRMLPRESFWNNGVKFCGICFLTLRPRWEPFARRGPGVFSWPGGCSAVTQAMVDTTIPPTASSHKFLPLV